MFALARAPLYFLRLLAAGVAQLVEHFLAKEDVARSSRVTRSPAHFEQVTPGFELITQYLITISDNKSLKSP